MSERVWTISNLLSLSRIFLLAPITSLLILDDPNGRWPLLLLMAVAALTDALDGYFARRLNQVTEIGKVLDPLADKIAIGVVCTVLTSQGKLPVWFLAVVLVRDGLILAGGHHLKRKLKIVLQSNSVGKWAATVIAAYLILVVLNYKEWSILINIFLSISTVMLIWSFILYLQRFLQTVRSIRVQNPKSRI